MPDPASRLLRNALRELRFVLVLWTITVLWTVGVSYFMGYGRSGKDVQLILGFPDWAFFGVFLPWMFSTAATVWFCLFYMSDDDLGHEQGEALDGRA